MGPKGKKGKKDDKNSKDDDNEIDDEESRQLQTEEDILNELQERKKTEEMWLKEIEWQKFREIQLPETNKMWEMVQMKVDMYKTEFRGSVWWEKYIRNPCGRPDPLIPQDVFTFFSLWESKLQNLKAVVLQNKEALALLSDIQMSEDLFPDISEFIRTSWIEQTTILESLIEENLKKAAFKVLLEAQNFINLQTGNLEFFASEDGVILCLWSSFTKNVKNRSFENEEINLSFEIPNALVVLDCAVQVRYTEYDHFSHYCRTYINKSQPNFEEPDPPLKKPQSLEEEKETNSKTGNGKPEKSSGEPPISEQSVIGIKENIEKETAKTSSEKLETEPELDAGEISFNEMIVLGGVWNIQLLEIPPQPSKVEQWTVVQEVPQILKQIEYDFPFTPPDPANDAKSSKKDAEEIEAELLRQQQEMEKLVLINTKLSDQIIWMENQLVPIIGRWDYDNQYWTNNHIYNVKFDEEKKIFSFRLAQFGSVAVFQNKYLALPYQAWSLLPLSKESIKISIQTSIIQAEFLMKNHQCSLTQLICNEQNCLETLYNKFFSPQMLLKEMQKFGINFFPEHDAHKFMKADLKLKDWNTEESLYKNISLICPAFELGASRWNNNINSKKIVFKLREFIYPRTKGPQHVVIFSLQKCNVLKIMETSQEFSEEEAPNQEFYSDLYHLMLAAGSEEAKQLVNNSSYPLKDGIYQLLCCMKPVSYCQ